MIPQKKEEEKEKEEEEGGKGGSREGWGEKILTSKLWNTWVYPAQPKML